MTSLSTGAIEASAIHCVLAATQRWLAPRKPVVMHPALEALIDEQDGLLTRQQSLKHMPADEIDSRLGRSWQVLLPGVYATFTGALTDRQHLRTALLHGGPQAMLNDATALRLQEVPYLPADPFRRVLVPAEVQRTSRELVVVRRTTRLPRPLTRYGLPVVPLHRALCEFGARHPDARDVRAVLTAAVQTNKCPLIVLHEEIAKGPTRGRNRLLRVAREIDSGVLSVSEGDFRVLVRTSKVVPEPKWNWLIELPDGTRISPDGMLIEAALIHEVNSREHHSAERAGEDAFESMQKRADLLVVAGFTVLQNTPARIRREGAEVLRELETCYLRDCGRGLPPGVRIIRAGPPQAMSHRPAI